MTAAARPRRPSRRPLTRRPRVHLVALLAATALVAAACGEDGSDSADAAPGGASSPSGAAAEPLEFTAATLSGGDFDAASLEGRDTVLWFWAPWCTTCRAEAPDVVESARELEGSVEVIGVAGRGEVPEMQGFVDDTGTGELQHIVDDDGSIWTGFGVAAQPAFAFVDDSGEVEVFVGALGKEALLERMRELAA